MSDNLTVEQRSFAMRKVKSGDTGPELIVRRMLHRLGFRFRLHQRHLPGSPDIVLARHRTVVLVHGCFWHRHVGCNHATNPVSNAEYWLAKFERNMRRDRQSSKELKAMGWRVVTVWECETRNPEKLRRKLLRTLH